MARKEIFTDDLDDSPDAKPIQFALEGKEYEIDLASKNADALRKALGKFIEKATLIGSGKRGPGRPKGSGGAKQERQYDLAALREWAAGKKIELPARGRIKQEIIDQYTADGGK